MIEIDITKMRGTQAVDEPRGLIAGMVCRMAISRKKRLATLVNCRMRDSR